jgi:hypothetical protein
VYAGVLKTRPGYWVGELSMRTERVTIFEEVVLAQDEDRIGGSRYCDGFAVAFMLECPCLGMIKKIVTVVITILPSERESRVERR